MVYNKRGVERTVVQQVERTGVQSSCEFSVRKRVPPLWRAYGWFLLLLVWCQRTSLIVLNKKADSTLSRSLIGSDEHCYFLKFYVKKYPNAAPYLTQSSHKNQSFGYARFRNTSPNISLHFPLFPILTARWWWHQSENCSQLTRRLVGPRQKAKDLFILFFSGTF